MRPRIVTVFLGAIVGVLLVAALSGCALFQGDVATDPQFVPTGEPMIDTGVDILDEEGFDTGRNWVLVDAGLDLPDEAPVVKPDDVEAGDKNAVSVLWGALEGLVPAPFRGAGMLLLYAGARLFGKRYRQNWGAALSNVAKGNVKEGIRMAAAAEGIVHTTEDPAKLKALAEKKAALAATEAKHPVPEPVPA
jgi:hypothetical protein